MKYFRSKFFWKIYLFFFLNSAIIILVFTNMLGYHLFTRIGNFFSINEEYFHEWITDKLENYYEKKGDWSGVSYENFLERLLISSQYDRESVPLIPPPPILDNQMNWDDDDDDDDDKRKNKKFERYKRERKKSRWGSSMKIPDEYKGNFLQFMTRDNNHKYFKGKKFFDSKHVSTKNLISVQILLENINEYVVLMDAKGEMIGGNFDISPKVKSPIMYKGEVVGWYARTSEKLIEDEGVKELIYLFIWKMAQMALWIFLFSGIIAYFLAILLLKPIYKLNDGLTAMTKKQFGYRMNITSNDELGELAAKYNEMAESMENFIISRKEWVSVISHELKTPLTIIRGEIEAVQDGVRELNPVWLENMRDEVLHLTKLTEDLKTLSLADSENFTLSLSETHLQNFLKMIVDNFQFRAEQNELAITHNLDESSDVYVNIDTYRMKQVIENIMENCIRYSQRPGAIRINLTVLPGQVFISVDDDGPGIPDDCYTKIFGRFFRLEESRSRSKGGSGLGLAICKSLVEANNGSIKAVKGDKDGLKINITLPQIAHSA